VPLRICLDPDGVVFDGAKMKKRLAMELYGVDIPASECSREGMCNGYLTHDQYEELKSVGYRSEEAMKFEFVSGADEKIRGLINRGDHVFMVSRRPSEGCEYLDRLLAVHGLAEVKSYSSEEAQDKTSVIESVGGADVFVDNDYKILKKVTCAKTLIFFADPNNQNGAEKAANDTSIKTARNWEELDGLLSMVAC
jgi:hypothetical protein